MWKVLAKRAFLISALSLLIQSIFIMSHALMKAQDGAKLKSVVSFLKIFLLLLLLLLFIYYNSFIIIILLLLLLLLQYFNFTGTCTPWGQRCCPAVRTRYQEMFI